MPPNMLKGLIFVESLTAEIQAKTLTNIKQNNITLQAIVDECQTFLSLKHDAEDIQKKRTFVGASKI